MQLEEIWKRQDILELLHDVLEAEETKNKISPFTKEGEVYGYNQYSLLIFIDFLIKYQIIIKEESLLKDTIEKLKEIRTTYQTHQELVVYLNSLLAELVRLKLGLTEKESAESKISILRYIYSEYIVNGYCFHSFPSVFRKSIILNGIDPKEYRYPIYEMKQTSHIFEKHNCKGIITKDLNDQTPFLALTDSPAMAYYHAIQSPEYFCNLTATGVYMKNEQLYDREAYYRKDKEACARNLSILSQQVRMSQKEQATVLNAFGRQWNLLNASVSFPCIAFVKRRDIGRDNLEDFDAIIEKAKEEDLILSVSKILDSRYPCIRRYQKIESNQLETVAFPAYQEIKQNKWMEKVEEPQEEMDELFPTKKPKKKKTHNENHTVLLLTILLIISIACLIYIILKLYGGI